MRGTLAPAFRASDRPIAIACFRLLTFFPERPDLSVPRFIARISRSTASPAFFEYFLPLDFLVGIGPLLNRSTIELTGFELTWRKKRPRQDQNRKTGGGRRGCRPYREWEGLFLALTAAVPVCFAGAAWAGRIWIRFLRHGQLPPCSIALEMISKQSAYHPPFSKFSRTPKGFRLLIGFRK